MQPVKDLAMAAQRLSSTPAVAQHSNNAPISAIQGLASRIFLGLTLSCFNFILIRLMEKKKKLAGSNVMEGYRLTTEIQVESGHLVVDLNHRMLNTWNTSEKEKNSLFLRG